VLPVPACGHTAQASAYGDFTHRGEEWRGQARRKVGAFLHDYELMYIVRPDVDDEKMANTVARVSGLITERGGEISKETVWGRKRLAYPINDFRDGLYHIVEFKVDPSHQVAIERQLRLTEDIIRHQIIIPGVNKQPPRVRTGGDGRGFGRGDGENRFGRGDGDSRFNRGDGENRFGRGDGESRFNRGDGENRFGRGDGDSRFNRDGGGRFGSSDRAASAPPLPVEGATDIPSAAPDAIEAEAE